MFSPENRPCFITKVRGVLQRNPTLTSMAYGISALALDGASRVISLPNQATNEFLISYGHDTLFPVQCYFALRATWLGNIHKDKLNWLGSLGGATAVFATASALELFQKVGVYSGTYDPGDFIAYGIGVGLAVTLDAITFKKTMASGKN